MARQVGRIVRLGTGGLFLLLGIAGLFLPILQGLLFIGIGLTILSTESTVARRLLERLRAHLPRHRSPHGEGR